MTTSSLSPALSVNDLLRTMPDAAPVLNRLGIDLCCGGSLSLADAAAAASLPLADLLTALREPAEAR